MLNSWYLKGTFHSFSLLLFLSFNSVISYASFFNVFRPFQILYRIAFYCYKQIVHCSTRSSKVSSFFRMTLTTTETVVLKSENNESSFSRAINLISEKVLFLTLLASYTIFEPVQLKLETSRPPPLAVHDGS